MTTVVLGGSDGLPVQDGFWFAPTEGRTKWGPYDADDPARKDYVVRGYDANDRQVYATTELPGHPGMHASVHQDFPRRHDDSHPDGRACLQVLQLAVLISCVRQRR
ncbi:hypothetical protein OG558_19445 [Kribbella sp. NBC_01510]|uniref:hypothetical protein n=1 Tax=Kribbella sp. NBC_01510 TaxID=2903581 RepID=UPI003869C5A4